MARGSPATHTHTDPGVRQGGGAGGRVLGVTLVVVGQARPWLLQGAGGGQSRTPTSLLRELQGSRLRVPLGCLLSPGHAQFASPERSCCREFPGTREHVARTGPAGLARAESQV